MTDHFMHITKFKPEHKPKTAHKIEKEKKGMKMPKLTLEDGREIVISQDSYDALSESVKPEYPWKPKINEGYFSFKPGIKTPYRFMWNGGYGDRTLLAMGHVFKTVAECRAWIDRRLAKKRIRDHAGDQSWIDWNDYKQEKHHVFYVHEERKLGFSWKHTNQCSDVAYYKTEELAKEAIKKHGDDYKILFGVE